MSAQQANSQVSNTHTVMSKAHKVHTNTDVYVCEHEQLNVYQFMRSVKRRLLKMVTTHNGTQPGLAPSYFLAYALGGIYLNAGYCDMYVPRRKPRTAIVFKNSTYTENNSLWRNLKLFRSFSCKNSNITHYSKH